MSCASEAENSDWSNVVGRSLSLRSLVDAEKPRRRRIFGANSRNSSSVELQQGQRGSGVSQILEPFLPKTAKEEIRLLVISGDAIEND